jgi:hypothetical protein
LGAPAKGARTSPTAFGPLGLGEIETNNTVRISIIIIDQQQQLMLVCEFQLALLATTVVDLVV